MSKSIRAQFTPKGLGTSYSVLGIFGLLINTAVVSQARDFPKGASAYLIFLPLMVLAAGLKLRRSSKSGWWLAWFTMLALSAGGVLPLNKLPEVPQLSRIFQAGFMAMGSGFCFAHLSHPDIYRPCFGRATLPHTLLLGTPFLLMLFGVGLAALDPLGRIVGPLVLIGLLFSGNAIWMAKPLIAAFKRDGRHDG